MTIKNKERRLYMKKIITLLLCAMCFFCLSGLVACEEKEHVCSWSDTVLINEYYHYQKCSDSSCEFENIISYHEWSDNFVDSDDQGHYYSCTYAGCNVLSPAEQHDWDDSVALPDEQGHYYNCKKEGCSVHSPIKAHNFVLDVVPKTNGVQAKKTCSDCEYSFIDNDIDTLAVSPSTVREAIDNLFTDTIITLNRGAYETIRIVAKSNVIIYAKEGVTVELLLISGDCKNICVYNVNFDKEGDANTAGKAGIKIEATKTLSNLTVKNCTFRHNAGILTDTWETVLVSNVKIENCNFYDIDRCSYNGWRTAIVFYSVRGITIQGCLFDTVQRHAIQVYMGDKASGLVIKDNVFKNIGGQVLHLNIYAENTVDVSGNTFYQELCSTNENTYIHKEYGAYVMATVAKVKIGANIWEVMPENRDKFFRNVEIDISEQTLLNK